MTTMYCRYEHNGPLLSIYVNLMSGPGSVHVWQGVLLAGGGQEGVSDQRPVVRYDVGLWLVNDINTLFWLVNIVNTLFWLANTVNTLFWLVRWSPRVQGQRQVRRYNSGVKLSSESGLCHSEMYNLYETLCIFLALLFLKDLFNAVSWAHTVFITSHSDT